MKLQLTPDVVKSLAAECGPSTPDLTQDVNSSIQAMVLIGHNPLTRRDLAAVLIERGVPSEVTLRDPTWGVITNALAAAATKVSGVRGYWTPHDQAVLPPPQKVVKKKVSKKIAVSDEPTLTTLFFAEQLEKGLDRRMAAILKRGFHLEEYNDLLSLCGEWLAIWGARGTCDKYILKGEPPTAAILAHWVKQKLVHQLTRDAQDGLMRTQKGVRTTFEREKRRDGGGKDFIHPEARRSGNSVKTVRTSSQSDPLEPVELEFVEPSPNALEMLSDQAASLEAARMALVRDIVRVERGRAADRYARIFDRLMSGCPKEEAAVLEGVSELRVSHLYQRVRDDMKRAPLLMQVSLQVLRLISEEPYSTLDELDEQVEELVPEVATSEDDTTSEVRKKQQAELHKALRLLVMRGLATEAKGCSYAPTEAGEEALEQGSLA